MLVFLFYSMEEGRWLFRRVWNFPRNDLRLRGFLWDTANNRFLLWRRSYDSGAKLLLGRWRCYNPVLFVDEVHIESSRPSYHLASDAVFQFRCPGLNCHGRLPGHTRLFSLLHFSRR